MTSPPPLRKLQRYKDTRVNIRGEMCYWAYLSQSWSSSLEASGLGRNGSRQQLWLSLPWNMNDTWKLKTPYVMIFFLNRIIMVIYGDLFCRVWNCPISMSFLFIRIQSYCMHSILYLGRNSEWCECMLLDLTDLWRRFFVLLLSVEDADETGRSAGAGTPKVGDSLKVNQATESKPGNRHI